MKTVVFDSVGGAAGDMILAAFAGLGADLPSMEKALREAMPEEDFRIVTEPYAEKGVSGLKLNVKILHDSAEERGLHEIEPVIERCRMTERAKELSLKTFRRIAEAEGKVHGKSAHHVHFHEVGAVDSIVDILGCCMAFDSLGLDGVSFGPLPEGTGTFRCRHGIYPLPAPATLELLTGYEIVRTEEPFEMVTPTGAALLTTFPKGKNKGKILKSACSFGSRVLKTRPNLLRATVLETDEAGNSCVLLETNLDDITAEALAAVAEKMMRKPGVLDVWLTPILMKKGRPATILSVLCAEPEADSAAEEIFRETGTFGIRIRAVERKILERGFQEKTTSAGTIRVKQGFLNGVLVTEKPEFEDCRKLAEQTGIPVRTILSGR